ncbi:hypothetical protein NITUZ_60012 [Candidatus Nitrosotenuis uzonensis]|uniref:Uncharacterized protein n=1 Tax=Candidatus Nitrosotenuis uzonensis TaxID=1407055 RepID=V6AV59_9ARCH|nr:hypothetical protein NITUZ_60012 [Candidatus Nitrosotenuis uzonensis]
MIFPAIGGQYTASSKASDACKNQDKTATIKMLPEKKCGFDVAGRHVSVPHLRHGKDVCDRVH